VIWDSDCARGSSVRFSDLGGCLQMGVFRNGQTDTPTLEQTGNGSETDNTDNK